ncbi:prepilin peptidase [Lactococcus garvieae]|jgi:leader peptidase (prepilin peptidase)/N-methyltransferase|uniref:Late competence protein ComC, processing protease n=1 Tax=Lactococcus garvieae DCC43 TaxID=1231377 RepID=K2PL59_9LACT|nr:A24 family peptidase [Lactococcus garvieae]EKF52055.1 Late competence protein ComC, processing protease [Lactococcus garvieae DCC43]
MMIFFSFLIGCIFGSFLGVVSDRWGSTAAIIWGRSHCNSCKRQLSWRHLIPLVSQIFYKSRCAYCQEAFSYSYFFLEFLTGLLFVAALDLSLVRFFTLLFSLLLSKFDIDSFSYPLSLGLFISILFFLCFPAHLLSYFCLALAFLAHFFDINIGAGDFLWLFLASFSLSLNQMLYLLQIASFCGLFFLLIKKERKLPFIPFLSLAYLIVILLPQIL